MMKKSLGLMAVLVICFGLLYSQSAALTAQGNSSTSIHTAKQTVTAVGFTIGGQILSSEGRPIPRCIVSMTGADGQVKTSLTNPFGYYRFFEVEAGDGYILSVRAKGHQFMSRTITVAGDDVNINFTPQE